MRTLFVRLPRWTGCLALLLLPFAVLRAAPDAAAPVSAPARAPAAGADDTLVVLPPFEVLAVRPWLYVAIPGCQILSLEDRRVTAEFAQCAMAEREFMAQLVPELPPDGTWPATTVILGGDELSRLREARPNRFSLPDFALLEAGGDRRLSFFIRAKPHRPRLSSVAQDWASLHGISLLHWLLDRHRELPEWYRQGLKHCGISLWLNAPGSTLPLNTSYSIHRGTVSALGWAKQGKDAPGRAPELWPLARLFATASRDAAVRDLAPLAREELALYRDQCVLFLHWGLRGGAKQREGFRRLVAAAGTRLVDEALFRECFGFGFEEGERRFLRFAREEVERTLNPPRRLSEVSAEAPFELRPPALSRGDPLSKDWVFIRPDEQDYDFLLTEDLRRGRRPAVEVRPAERAETCRLLGEAYLWTVLDVDDKTDRDLSYSSLRAVPEYPPLFDRALQRSGGVSAVGRQYLAKAEKLILPLCQQETGRDPELVALLGLIELRTERLTEAARHLRETVATGAARPAAYYDLARLQLDAALRAPEVAPGRPSRAQVEPVAVLLREALRRCPEFEAAYGLLAFAWGSTREVPPEEDLERLTRTARRCHENSAVLREIAALCERAGRRDEAAALARIGLERLPRRTPDGFREELRRLASLSPAPSNGQPSTH